MTTSVLIIGASGAIGVPLVEEFINQLHKFSKVGILSDPSRVSKFSAVTGRGIKIVPGSYFDTKAYSGYDTVISLAGNAIMRLQPAIIECAIAGGVTHFYPSEYGADLSQDAVKDIRYFQDKRVTRNHLAAAAKAHKDFKYTLMLTGALTEWTLSPPYGVNGKTVVAYGSPDAKIDVTSIPDVVKYIVLSTLLPFHQGKQKRELRLRGEQTTFGMLIDIISEIQGEKYDSTYLPVSEALAEQEKARKSGNEEEEMFWSLRSLGASGTAIVGEPLDTSLFDIKPESARETFQRAYGKK